MVKKMPPDPSAVCMCSQDAMVCVWRRKNIMQQLNSCSTVAILMETFRTKHFENVLELNKFSKTFQKSRFFVD